MDIILISSKIIISNESDWTPSSWHFSKDMQFLNLFLQCTNIDSTGRTSVCAGSNLGVNATCGTIGTTTVSYDEFFIYDIDRIT